MHVDLPPKHAHIKIHLYDTTTRSFKFIHLSIFNKSFILGRVRAGSMGRTCETPQRWSPKMTSILETNIWLYWLKKKPTVNFSNNQRLSSPKIFWVDLCFKPHCSCYVMQTYGLGHGVIFKHDTHHHLAEYPKVYGYSHLSQLDFSSLPQPHYHHQLCLAEAKATVNLITKYKPFMLFYETDNIYSKQKGQVLGDLIGYTTSVWECIKLEDIFNMRKLQA